MQLSTPDMLHCRDAAGQDNPLQLGMTTELLADSFLKALFMRFYHMLQSHGPIAHKGLQVWTCCQSNCWLARF